MINLLNILCRQGYGLDDAYNGSAKLVEGAKTTAISIVVIITLVFIVCIFFVIHDSGRSSGDKTVKQPKNKENNKKD